MNRIDPFVPYAGDWLDDLVRSGLVHPPATPASHEKRIRLDVAEDHGGYTICAELPGVRREDVTITVEGPRVVVHAEARRGTESASAERLLHSDRYYGSMRRDFALPNEIHSDGAEARLDSGILVLRLPKKAARSSRPLSIA